MSKLRMKISMSLDGFVAGPNQSVENPLGVGGMRLHEWVFELPAWRGAHGMDADADLNSPSNKVVEESMENIGATIMGRNMFGGHPGAWDREKPWNGWWGDDPPFHHPVFVLTHHPREKLVHKGGNTFTFVTDGIESALRQAGEAAAGKDISLAGGAKTVQQYFNAGLIDEMEINLVPTILGDGERLFEGTGGDLHGMTLVRTVATMKVTHLKYVRS